MKYFSTLFLFFFAVLSCAIDILTYNYTIINKTGRAIEVQLHSVLGKLGKFRKIEDGKKYKFSFPIGSGKASWCLTDIEIKNQPTRDNGLKHMRPKWGRYVWETHGRISKKLARKYYLPDNAIQFNRESPYGLFIGECSNGDFTLKSYKGYAGFGVIYPSYPVEIIYVE